MYMLHSAPITYVHMHIQGGPMEVGLHPHEASERMSIFQAQFDELWSKLETYTGGEQLFGIPVTDYPDLENVRKELGLLQKLYGLYNAVIDTIDGYYDILWTDVDIEKINNELIEFQSRYVHLHSYVYVAIISSICENLSLYFCRCRKLPKGMKEWPAFNDLKSKIDDFNETCPLLEMMANRAMKDRHWERISAATSHTFDIHSESFALRHIMETPLLLFKDDIEDICISAVKEKDIEAKLKQVVTDWNFQSLTFGSFKTRGELLLKGNETSEVVSLMEDSLMVLGSLMSNRYIVLHHCMYVLIFCYTCIYCVISTDTMLPLRRIFSCGFRNCPIPPML